MSIRKTIAAGGALALALALAGAAPAAAQAPAAAVPIAQQQAVPFAPAEDRARLEAYVLEQKANGNEAKVLADAKKSDAAHEEARKQGKKTAADFKGRIKHDDPAKKKGGQGGSAMGLPCANPCFFYNSFHQFFSADPAEGTTSIMTVGKPQTDAPNWEHSLGEISVHSDVVNGQRDAVEVGWTVDKAQRPDGNPILFGFHWVDGVPKGYGVGFVDYAPNPINLGAGLPKPVNKKFLISQTSTAWWVYYDTDYVAYVPKSRWTPGGVVRPFNAPNAGIYLAQHFYEIAADNTEPCTDMATGTPWNATGTPTPPVATITNYANAGTAIVPSFTQGGTNNPPDAVWGTTLTSPTSGTAGGPGYDADGNDTAPAVGTTGAC